MSLVESNVTFTLLFIFMFVLNDTYTLANEILD